MNPFGFQFWHKSKNMLFSALWELNRPPRLLLGAWNSPVKAAQKDKTRSCVQLRTIPKMFWKYCENKSTRFVLLLFLYVCFLSFFVCSFQFFIMFITDRQTHTRKQIWKHNRRRRWRCWKLYSSVWTAVLHEKILLLYKHGGMKTNQTLRNQWGYVADVSNYHNAGIWSMD